MIQKAPLKEESTDELEVGANKDIETVRNMKRSGSVTITRTFFCL